MSLVAPPKANYKGRIGRTLLQFCSILVILAVPIACWAVGDGHEVEPKGWTMTDTARVINFVVLAALLFLALRKPAAKALNGRIDNITTELEDLENRKADVEKQLADYNDRLASLDKEAEQIIAEYIRQGEEAKTRILKEAQSSADKLEEQAQKNIEFEFDQARNALQKAVVEKALVKAEQVIKTRISSNDQERLVDEYLNKVVVQ